MTEALKTTQIPGDSTAAFVSVDWGTTNLRTVLVSTSGDVIASNNSEAGLQSARGSFSEILIAAVENWLDGIDDIPVIMSGMIGSSMGWIEVPYVGCPISANTLANGITTVDAFTRCSCWIVPGVRGLSINGAPDVMRGEEVQVLGAIEWFERQGHGFPEIICLPGTHNKWVNLSGGVAKTFSTTMTGEIFDLLSNHSILSQTIDQGAAQESDAFAAGLAASETSGGILHHLFSIRVRKLLADRADIDGRSYLSGLLVGCELRGMMLNEKSAKTIGIVGSPSLIDLYRKALDYFGLKSVFIGSEAATIAGHIQVARAASLLAPG